MSTEQQLITTCFTWVFVVLSSRIFSRSSTFFQFTVPIIRRYAMSVIKNVSLNKSYIKRRQQRSLWR
jgi:hypothetical protein